MIKKYALIFLVFGFQMAWTQNNVNNKIDSLKSLLAKTNTDTTKVNLNNSLSIIYLTVNTSEGIKYGETALELAKKIKYQVLPQLIRSSQTISGLTATLKTPSKI